MIVDALAAYRLTRLVTTDVVARPFRARVTRFAYEHAAPTVDRVSGLAAAEQALEAGVCSAFDDLVDLDPCPPGLAKLVSCRWCASVYIGFGVVALRRFVPRVWDPVARGLALSAAAVLVAGLEHTE